MGSKDDILSKLADVLKKDPFESVPVPQYYRIRELLKEQIKLGSLKTGDQIPTEGQLSESFQVSRMTARRAVDELVREGKLVRRQGVGTFVAASVIGRQLTRLTTLSEELEQLNYKGLKSRTLSWGTHRASKNIAALLGIEVKDPVLRVKRVRYTDDIPLAMQTIYLPGKLASGLQETDLIDHSLYQLFEERFDKRVEWGKQQINAIPATHYLAKWLEVVPGSPLFKVTRCVFLKGGQPFDVVRTFYRADRYSFQLNLYRDK